MGSLEILTYVAVAAFALGFLVCWLVKVIPLELDNEALRLRNTARGIQKIHDDMDALAYRAKLQQEVHKGTPYIDKPGVRVVNGEGFYSSAWLDQAARIQSDNIDLARDIARGK